MGFIFLLFPVVVKSHVCLLKKRADPSRGGTLRWSLPYDEICYCQSVVAPRSQKTCPQKDDPMDCSADGLSCNLWFVDDPTPLTQRQNWNKETLDRLLERADHCGKCDAKLLVDFVQHKVVPLTSLNLTINSVN